MSANKTNVDDDALDNLRRYLRSDPTNLELANRYWQALSDYKGHDARSGRDLVEAYRGRALMSAQGAIALAKAYKELFDVSGEAPRAKYFDQELIRALLASQNELDGDERSALGWVLKHVL